LVHTSVVKMLGSPVHKTRRTHRENKGPHQTFRGADGPRPQHPVYGEKRKKK